MSRDKMWVGSPQSLRVRPGYVWLLCSMIGLISAPAAFGQTIATIAGREMEEGMPIERSRGDGGPATEAVLLNPFNVFADGQGNLYIADTANDRIRRVDPTGRISTVAGNGEYGSSGDGGPATEARLREPMGVCLDGEGNLYIADTLNGRIRRADASGRITTLAGDGQMGHSGDGGPSTEAQLANPIGICLDREGGLYVADQGNHRIRRIDPSGRIVTVVGNVLRGFSGNGGPATDASLADPFGVFVDGTGVLYIADRSNNRIRRVDPSGAITTVAGNGTAGYSGDGAWPRKLG